MTSINNINTYIKAIELIQKGFSVIPVGTDKKPLILSWLEYQKRQPTTEEITRWQTQYFDAGIGIITGSRFKLIVIDVDVKHANKNGLNSIQTYGLIMPPTYLVKTPSGGWHYYYLWPENIPAPTKTDIYSGIDLRGDGGYVVAPPSYNENGAYEAVNSMDEMADAPQWLIDLAKQENQPKKDWQKISAGVSEGSRNDSATVMAGKLLSCFKPNEWENLAWPQFKAWNQQNHPPLPEKELRTVFDSISYKELQNSSRRDSESLAQQIITTLMEQKPKLFTDQFREGYVHTMIDQHTETLPIRSHKFTLWARRLFWKNTGRTVGQETLATAIATIEGKAIFEGETIHLDNRVSKRDGTYWYDLSNPEWSAIKINENGWQLISDPPVIFKRETHQKTQLLPVQNGDINLLLPFINIPSEAHKTLLLVYIVSCLIPDIPHPILVIHGDHGSAKSTLLRMIRRIIDPSETELLSLPKPDEAIQQIAHHWMPFYDNVRSLSDSMSDILCRAVTGEGSTKRALYTNDEDVIFSFRRCPALNGINVATQAADLLDRSILIRLERISPQMRRDEKSLWAEFNDALPKIFGGVLDVLSKALAIKPIVKLDTLPRMADFALWGYAIAEAMGRKGSEFITAYEENIRERNEEVLSGNLIASCVVALMERQSLWTGTPSELYQHFEELATELKIKTANKDWPKAANVLTRRLNEVKTNLADIGITIEISRDRKRIIKISKNTTNNEAKISTNTLFQPDGCDDNDGIPNF